MGFSAFYYYGSAIENGIHPPSFGGLTLPADVFVLLAALTFSLRDSYT